MRATLPLFEVPQDLLSRLRWGLMWLNVASALGFGAMVVLQQSPLDVRLTGAVGAVGFAVIAMASYRRRGPTLLLDAAALACAWGVMVGMGNKVVVINFTMTWVTYIQLYGSAPRVLLRVLGLVAAKFGTLALGGYELNVGTDVGGFVGVTFASLFPHLLARALAGLQASEARFRSLVQHSSDLVFVTGPDSALRYRSPPAELFLGAGAADLGTRLADRVAPGDGPRLLEALAAAVAEPTRTVRAEVRLQRADGSLRACEALVSNRLADENVAGLVLNVRDVTDRRAAESALQDAKHEIEIAARIQTALLPPRREVPGFDIATAMLPASQVGGDYFDVIPFRGGVFVGVGDVAGHGLTAGLVMLMTQSVVSALAQANPDAAPRDLVLQLNRVLHENVRQRLGNREHLTFTLLKVRDDGTVQYAGAHEEILVRRAATGAVESFPTRGAWLGAVPDLSHAVFQQELRLLPGDVLLLHTDGITEARNDSREEYGPERLEAALARSGDAGSDQLCFQLMRQVEAFSPDRADDRSVVVLRYVGPPVSGQLDRDVVGGEARQRV